jgi:hypothetical protein
MAHKSAGVYVMEIEHRFTDDESDRLKRLLDLQDVKCRPFVTTALATAARQLEIIKPFVLVAGGYMGPVAQIARGTFVIVLANNTRCLTLQVTRPFVGTRLELVEELVDKLLGEWDGETPWSSLTTIQYIRLAIDKYGALPGKDRVRGAIDMSGTLKLIGALFAPYSPELRREIFSWLESLSDKDICPVLVGLIGRDKEKHYCGCWPLSEPLAPYIEAVDTVDR